MSTYVHKRARELGLSIVDARHPLSIEVVEDDVRQAKRKNSRCCAFAKAAQRQVDRIKHAYFFRTTAWLEYEDRMVRYTLPIAVQKEIVSFDRSQKMAPGFYTLDKPSPSQRLDGSKTRKGREFRSTEKRKRKSSVTRKVRNRTPGVRSLFEPKDA